MATAAKALDPQQIERRRSERFASRVTLQVCGICPLHGAFREETLTLSMNSHGALFALSADVALGQKLLLMNVQTWNEVEARVSRLAGLGDKWTAVAVEFVQPTPHFWSVGAAPRRVLPQEQKADRS